MPRLELIDVTKRYAQVLANDRVCLRVEPGEIHAVLGENGAGKSTLMKMIYGAVQPDAGEIRWEGRAVRLSSPRSARALGVAMVFQHFSLFESFTVSENVRLGVDERLSKAAIAERLARAMADYGVEIDPDRPVHALSMGERQRVEILRALIETPRVLILDEPTSVLDPPSVARLFVTLRKLAGEGCAILYVSHKLDEIRAVCDRCTVLRGGRVVGEVDPSKETNAGLSRLMIGAEPVRPVRSPPRIGAVALSVNGLTLPPRDRFGVALEGIDLSVRAGEVVGVAGISGNGQGELLAAISGEDTRAPRGTIRLFGGDVVTASPRRRRALGLRFVPEDRLGRAVVPALSLAANTLLTREEGVGRFGFLRPRRSAALARGLIDRFDVKVRGPEAPAGSLSGGNLQRFIVGREVDAGPAVLVVSQPTWGVDVGAAAQIRGEILKLRDDGCAVLVVSEELDELFEISDTMVVMAQGRLSPPLAPRELTTEQIGQWMGGAWPRAGDTTGGAVAPGVTGAAEMADESNAPL
jgi:general nucleoside transport system ATP-binding protein